MGDGLHARAVWVLHFTVQIQVHHLEASTIGLRVLTISHGAFLVLVRYVLYYFLWVFPQKWSSSNKYPLIPYHVKSKRIFCHHLSSQDQY